MSEGTKIVAPANEVEGCVGFGIKEQRVDREIAPLHVFLRRTRVHHAVRMSTIGIADVGAEGGDLNLGLLACA